MRSLTGAICPCWLQLKTEKELIRRPYAGGFIKGIFKVPIAYILENGLVYAVLFV